MTTESKAFFDKTAHLVTDGNIVYATDLNNPLTAIETGQTALINALQTGATIFTATDTGAVNAYAINPAAALTEYSDGQTVWLKPGATNTGASTINVSSLGAKDIRTTVRTALVGGELIAGYWAQLKYSSTLDAFVIVSERGKTDTETEKTIAGGTGIAVASTDDTITVSIEDGGVDTTQLADEAVTADKIADGTITQDKLVAVFSAMSGVPPNCQVHGFEITNTGTNELTVTKGQCLDSTLSRTISVSASTVLGAAQGVPTSNNTVFVVAAVILTNGTHTCLAYADEAAMAADVGVNITHCAYIGWWQNNGSGVAKAGRLIGVGDGLAELWWAKASENACTSKVAPPAGCSTAVSLASYLPSSDRVAAVFPGGQSSGSANYVAFGFDGTNASSMATMHNVNIADNEYAAWLYSSGTWVPIVNNTIYWGDGSYSNSGTADIRLHATRFRR